MVAGPAGYMNDREDWLRRTKVWRDLQSAARGGKAQHLLAGYPRGRIHYLARGVPIPPERSTDAKTSARAALTATNSGLRLPDDAPLAVYVGRLHESKGLLDLVADKII